MGALSAHTTTQRLGCPLLGGKSDGMITGAEGQVRWSQGSLSDRFHLFTRVLGTWQQRQGLGAGQGHSLTKDRLLKAPRAPQPLSACWLQGPGLYRSAPSPVLSLQLLACPGLSPSLAWRHTEACRSTPHGRQSPATLQHTYSTCSSGSKSISGTEGSDSKGDSCGHVPHF